MEIILGENIDWIQDILRKRFFAKWFFTAVIFGIGCWLSYVEWYY